MALWRGKARYWQILVSVVIVSMAIGCYFLWRKSSDAEADPQTVSQERLLLQGSLEAARELERDFNETYSRTRPYICDGSQT